MQLKGPIIIIEDDLDDQEILVDAFQEIGVEKKRLIFFDKTSDAFHFLMKTEEQPFLILSDVNLPGENGVEFKRHVDKDPYLRQKSIPFIFFSTAVDKRYVDMAYQEMTVQGFFKKSSNYTELKNLLRVIMDYWNLCKHPNRPNERG